MLKSVERGEIMDGILMPTLQHNFRLESWCGITELSVNTLKVQLIGLDLQYTPSKNPRNTLTITFEDDAGGRVSNIMANLPEHTNIRVSILGAESSYFNFNHVTITSISYSLNYASSKIATYTIVCNVGEVSRTID